MVVKHTVLSVEFLIGYILENSCCLSPNTAFIIAHLSKTKTIMIYLLRAAVLPEEIEKRNKR